MSRTKEPSHRMAKSCRPGIRTIECSLLWGGLPPCEEDDPFGHFFPELRVALTLAPARPQGGAVEGKRLSTWLPFSSSPEPPFWEVSLSGTIIKIKLMELAAPPTTGTNRACQQVAEGKAEEKEAQGLAAL